MVPNKVIIKGARVHNLKNITVEIPKNKFVVITGLSGSGKSSLAFDTLYAEGQRRYVESLSAYARQFLGVMRKPDVDYIEGLSPAISLEPRTPSRNPRSTVGTVTEIYDYLRLLFARIGVPYCYKCGRRISSQTEDQIVDKILELQQGTRMQVLAPVVRGRKGEYKDLFARIKRKGYVRVRVNGEDYDIDDTPDLDKYRKHDIDIIVDRLVMKEGIEHRLADSCEIALKEGDGILVINEVDNEEDHIFSTKLACPVCGISYEEISTRMFSFNSPFGACPECHGLGTRMELDPDAVITHPSLSILEGAIAPWGEPGKKLYWELKTISKRYEVDFNTPYQQLNDKVKQVLLYGDSSFEGVMPNLLRRYRETESDYIRSEIEKYMTLQPCRKCNGARLKKESLAIRVAGKNIYEVTSLSIKDARNFFENFRLDEKKERIAKEILKEITRRLAFLLDVGLDYLTLSRKADTLSGGEDERVRLATQIGSGLVGVVYILDEPSVGLHQRDNIRLLNTLKTLRDMGNTVVVVEHDKETIMQADHLIDLGPGAGEHGGEVVATGTPGDVMQNRASLTGQYLCGKRRIETPKKRRPLKSDKIVLKKAKHNNLKSIDVEIPLGVFVVVTGVSGSGKSSLVNDTLYRALARHFYHSRQNPGEHDVMINIDKIDKVVNIDQSPIGRTPRSNPATYTGAFDHIRALFAKLKDSRIRGYKPGRFSFNVPGGRCEACGGAGLIKVEMHFLPDVYIPCEACKGNRFNRETLEITYKGKNISDVLNMTVTEAKKHFEHIPKVLRKLKLLQEVGLGYIKLGQSATTLSGGEAQRIKLSKELSKIATGQTLYLLDEPTTGMHFEDVKLLLAVLKRLVDMGNTVLVIEHNPEVIKCADHIIDLGPEGGDAGGYIVAKGTPEQVAECKRSYTGALLKNVLNH